MSYDVSPDEVADDYLQALRGLEMNSRYEISNLTVIAKENTEHALAIAEAVKTHIKQVGRTSLHVTRYSSNLSSHAPAEYLPRPRPSTYTLPGSATQEIARFLRPRFSGQECWHAIYAFLRPAIICDLHGSICLGGHQYPQENGRDAENMEGACSRIHGYKTGVSS